MRLVVATAVPSATVLTPALFFAEGLDLGVEFTQPLALPADVKGMKPKAPSSERSSSVVSRLP